MSPTDTDLKQAQIRQLEAEIAHLQASTIRTQAGAVAELFNAARGNGTLLGQAGRTNVIKAVTSNDLGLLITLDNDIEEEISQTEKDNA